MKKINRFIAPEIYANISQNTRITSIIGECLPDEFRVHVECIGSNGETLKLAASSAALASQLRFYIDPLLTALHNANLTQFKTIKISSDLQQPTTAFATPTNQFVNKPSMSAKTTQMIRATASSIDDARLRRVMIRLAQLADDT